MKIPTVWLLWKQENMDGRCGPLCQHPGCWHSGERIGHYQKNHNGYLQYLDYLTLRRKTSKKRERHYSSDYYDLPTLTVTDVTERVHPQQSPPLRSRHWSLPPLNKTNDSVLLNSSWSSTNSSEIEQKNKPFSFTQFILEEDLHPNSYSLTPPTLNDFSFTPLLLWQPNPTNYQKTNKQTNNKEERENKILKMMDLTDCLPPEQQSLSSSTKPSAEVKRTRVRSTRGRRSEGFTLDQYLVDGLSDMPPHIVTQIIEHLCSHSHVNVASDENAGDKSVTFKSPLPALSSSYPPPQPPPSSHVPSSLVLNLSSQKIYQTHPHDRHSLTKKGQKSTESFSRVLSTRPADALSGLKAKMAELQLKANQPISTSNNECNEENVPLQQTQSHMATFPGISTLQPPTAITSGTSSYFAPRGLPKATLQRLTHHSHSTQLRDTNQQSKLKLIPLITSAHSRRTPILESLLQPQRRPSVHLPSNFSPDVLPPYSEEMSTRPDTQTRPESRTQFHSSTALSHTSSDHIITGADLASQTGELLLLNREGQVVHEITRTETDLSLPLDSFINLAYEGQGECPSELEDGSIAPPPTAHEEQGKKPHLFPVIFQSETLHEDELGSTETSKRECESNDVEGKNTEKQ